MYDILELNGDIAPDRVEVKSVVLVVAGVDDVPETQDYSDDLFLVGVVEGDGLVDGSVIIVVVDERVDESIDFVFELMGHSLSSLKCLSFHYIISQK